ncbi:MAG: putative O-glycosylation ligase, exosortase A system-associated [Candidatus Vecturithrix sp.]|jgi:probable O-glycosylation ligase (exosortase A-associated)|nr:putative O-glycosylation ligase, exosortase A system-associated [Candidatus Vecturithrix sp.]
MPFRDAFLFIFIFGSLPVAFKRPYIGVLICAWLGYMNPHRYSWGPAYNFSFVAIVVIVTLLGFFLSAEKKELPNNIVIPLLFIFLAWVTLTTFTALNPLGAKMEWNRFWKIQMLNFLAIYLFQSRERINWLVAVIACSIGFFAFKGGIFTISTGGIYMVSGPADSFITGNTELGFAATVILPLIFYLGTIATKMWHKNFCILAIIFSTIGIIGTHSRGAFLALGVLSIYFWLVSRRKLLTMLILLFTLPILFSVMPDKYFERMETIKTYEEDASANGRINAWWFAYNLSKDRPILGGGANAFTRDLFHVYAPEPYNHHDAHSIYFEILGEQGYPGLVIFCTILFFSYRNCVYARRRARDKLELKWAFDLARMLQASFVAYLVGGAFLGLAYFDLLYHLVALSVLLRVVVDRELQSSSGPPLGQLPVENQWQVPQAVSLR